MTRFEHLTSSLKQAGMRLTPQRAAICRLLSESRSHPTAAQVHERIRAKYPSLSLMTVYNTLNVLVEIGAVNALGRAGDGETHYDANTSPHINLACVSCHRVLDLESPRVASLERVVRSQSGFDVLGARIVYYGLCPDCQRAALGRNHPEKRRDHRKH
jgi:Fur family peroxide stress response transcriptional regulator